MPKNLEKDILIPEAVRAPDPACLKPGTNWPFQEGELPTRVTALRQ